MTTATPIDACPGLCHGLCLGWRKKDLRSFRSLQQIERDRKRGTDQLDLRACGLGLRGTMGSRPFSLGVVSCPLIDL